MKNSREISLLKSDHCQDEEDSKTTNTPSTMQTIAGVMGNDIIAQVFFPPSDAADDDAIDYGAEIDTSNLINSFAVYGGAFLMRPVGGLTIGYVGDRYGRKQAGMSVGGQLPASLIYTVEIRPRKHWGYYGALVMMASNCGTLLGNFVGAFMRAFLTDEQLLSWGWRIPFLSGILIAFVAMYLRDHGVDHNPNAGEYDDDNEDSGDVSKQAVSKHLLSEVFKRENLPALGSATLTPMLWGAGFYTTFVWMAIYMKVLCNPPYEHAFWINAAALLFGIILPLPLTGMLSDKIGRDKTMGFGVVGLAISGPLMIKVIAAGNPVAAFFAQCTLGVFLSLFGGPMNAWLVEKFPPNIRLTSAALGYDLAHCTASAFSPLVATLLVQEVSITAPGYIYPFFAVFAVIGMFMSTKIHQSGGVEDESNVQMGSFKAELPPIT
eukprot:scaffold39724_cov226-Skeletonema_marinoi.AAC.2